MTLSSSSSSPTKNHSSFTSPTGQPQSKSQTQTVSNSGKPLPAIGLKWGVGELHHHHHPGSSITSTTRNNDDDDEQSPKTPDFFTTYYTPEEQEKLRAKGINPVLKAEMEWSKNNDKKGKGKGIWAKVAGTAMGGGWIK